MLVGRRSAMLVRQIVRNASFADLFTGDKGETVSYLELSAHMTVRPGCLDGFKNQAAELIRITKEKDTNTLRYDWFISTDGDVCEVREAYTGPEGLIEHNKNIMDARAKLFAEFADDHYMTIYGDVSEPLLELLKKHAAGHKWFVFLEGLEGQPETPLRSPLTEHKTA